jgi:hypothetical protein
MLKLMFPSRTGQVLSAYQMDNVPLGPPTWPDGALGRTRTSCHPERRRVLRRVGERNRRRVGVQSAQRGGARSKLRPVEDQFAARAAGSVTGAAQAKRSQT